MYTFNQWDTDPFDKEKYWTLKLYYDMSHTKLECY